MIELKRYDKSEMGVWNQFVCHARNATFLFDRGYMDYHADRFDDFSLMAYRNSKLIALLPANRKGDTLYSHQGLTYGGWITSAAHFDGVIMLELWDVFLEYCRWNGIKEVIYKPLPYIYSHYPAQEDIYALFRCGAERVEVNLSSTVDMSNKLGFNMSKRQQLRKALKQDVIVEETSDFAPFWSLLHECLSERHDARPVHTLEEITLLANRFPDNIRLITLSDSEGLQAGVCVFDTGKVAHSQYTATTAKARNSNYLTVLYDYLINNLFAERAYFDFGTSNESNGKVLNAGLLNQKYCMGGTGVAYEIYKIRVD